MPNWCDNTITLRHDNPEMINRAFNAIKESKFLQEFIPVPDELLNTDSPNNKNGDELVAKYGYSDWYDFCVNEWGTKWDMGSVSVEKDGDNELTFCAESAWAPPIEAYKALAKMGFDIEAFYHESGMCFVGKVTTDNGEIFDEYYEYNGETSETVRDVIGDELDDYYGISENMAMWEDENGDE